MKWIISTVKNKSLTNKTHSKLGFTWRFSKKLTDKCLYSDALNENTNYSGCYKHYWISFEDQSRKDIMC